MTSLTTIRSLLAHWHLLPAAAIAQPLALTTILPFVALQTSISYLPLTLFLAYLLASFSPSSTSAFGIRANPVKSLLLLTLGASLARVGPTSDALSTPFLSVIILALGSFASIFIHLIPIYIFVYVAPKIHSQSARILLFPALWSTILFIASSASPLGRLGVWTPVYGMQAYSWLLPMVGQIGQDWIVALSACVILQVAEAAQLCDSLILAPRQGEITLLGDPGSAAVPIMRSFTDDRSRGVMSPLLESDLSSDDGEAHTSRRSYGAVNGASALINYEAPTNGNTDGGTLLAARASTNNSLLRTTSASTLSIILLAILAAPSLIPSYIHTYPESSTGPKTSTTEFSVACVLPQFEPSTSRKSIFDEYLAQSRTLSAAKVILWPESAVRFDTATEKAAQLEKVQALANDQHIWVGVGFDDFAPLDEGNEGRREGMRRNGMALVGPEGVVFETFKQNLVPITESFSILPSHSPPPIVTIQLPWKQNARKNKWIAFRPIRITAAICLDFAHPSTFSSLSPLPNSEDPDAQNGPDLILAPGKTWDLRIGEVMHEQVRMRADELGAMALWCDGDAGGLSGVVGRGEGGVQRGRRSFIRNIAIPYHENGAGGTHRTLYGRWGDWTGIAMVWIMVLGSLAVGSGHFTLPDRETLSRFASQPFGYASASIERVRQVVQRLRRRETPVGNLINV